MERENLNPPGGLRASHEWMGDVIAKRKRAEQPRGTTGCDVYEVRPRKSGDGVDLISDRFRYGPIWYAGPEAVRNAIAYANYHSWSWSRRAIIRVFDESDATVCKAESAGDFTSRGQAPSASGNCASRANDPMRSSE